MELQKYERSSEIPDRRLYFAFCTQQLGIEYCIFGNNHHNNVLRRGFVFVLREISATRHDAPIYKTFGNFATDWASIFVLALTSGCRNASTLSHDADGDYWELVEESRR